MNAPRKQLTKQEYINIFLSWLNNLNLEEKTLLLNLWNKNKEEFWDQYRRLPQANFEKLMTIFWVNFAKTILFYPSMAEDFNIYCWSINPESIETLPQNTKHEKWLYEMVFINWIFYKQDTQLGKIPYFQDIFNELDKDLDLDREEQHKKLLLYYRIFRKYKEDIINKINWWKIWLITKNASQQIVHTLKDPEINSTARWVNISEPIRDKKTKKIIATKEWIIVDIEKAIQFVKELFELAKQSWWEQLRDLILLGRLNSNNMRLLRKNDSTIFLAIYRQNFNILTQENIWSSMFIHKPISWYQYYDWKRWPLKNFCNDWLYIGNANFSLSPESNFEQHIKEVMQLDSDVKFAREIKNEAKNQFTLPCWTPVVIIDSNINFISSIRNLSQHKWFLFTPRDKIPQPKDWLVWISGLRIPWFQSWVFFETTKL